LNAIFVELPAFERNRARYFTDDEFANLQATLMRGPGGAVIKGTGGLRKLRFADSRRGKGSRGGLRLIYYYWSVGRQFWLFTVYDKDEVSDLTAGQRKVLEQALKAELCARRMHA
jgi:hypothetical protein